MNFYNKILFFIFAFCAFNVQATTISEHIDNFATATKDAIQQTVDAATQAAKTHLNNVKDLISQTTQTIPLQPTYGPIEQARNPEPEHSF